jgi:hypothetical protein
MIVLGHTLLEESIFDSIMFSVMEDLMKSGEDLETAADKSVDIAKRIILKRRKARKELEER